MKLTIPDGHGEPLDFECEDTVASAWVSREILMGHTYPALPFLDDVRVVLDVGANCGAAAVHFARSYPDAVIHAFEPGSHQRSYLERNAASWDRIEIEPIGLHRHDRTMSLYAGATDSGMSSITPSEWTSSESETVTLRAAGGWLAQRGIERIDVVKVDVEGCEVDVLASLGPWLPDVMVLHVEYDSRQARREIAGFVEPTHELLVGKLLLDQGECTYLRSDLASRPEVTPWLRSVFTGSGESLASASQGA